MGGWLVAPPRRGPPQLDRFTLWMLLPAALAWLWLANRATGPGGLYDTGLYHLAAVRWNREHAIVPGLANLHHRLGFNNAGLL